MSQVNWVSGPQTINLADAANIDIPAGYRLTDVSGARLFLQAANNPVPKNLIGLLSTDSGKWWAVVEYTPEGYVKDADARIDAAAALKSLQAQTQNGSITSMSWGSQPVYNPQTHSLAWSLQVNAASMQALNESVVLLGRRGYFQITAFHPVSLADAPSLAQLAGNINFKDGERYSDYQSGDKVASVGMTDLVVGGPSETQVAANKFGGPTAVWIFSGIAVVILSGGAFFLLKKKNHRHHHHHSRSSHAQGSAPVATATAAATPAVSNVSTPKPAMAMSNGNGQHNGAAANGNGSSKKQFHRHRRKKAFSYPKFYTHVMRELSLHSYGPAATPANGKSRVNGHANGHQNGSANGHANGHTNGANGHSNGANGTNGNGVHDTMKAEIVDLIATQKNLINEQKCLLEQQTKLIEEKRWLIEEQTAFLKGQAEQQFPLKFES